VVIAKFKKGLSNKDNFKNSFKAGLKKEIMSDSQKALVAKYKEIVAKGEPYTDPDFPPEFCSIAHDSLDAKQVEGFKK